MALTITNVKKNVVGAQRELIADIDFDSSYPAGGEAFSPRDVDPTLPTSASFHFVAIQLNDATIADNRIFSYDHTNKKIIMYTAVNTEATGNQAAVKVRVLCRYSAASG
jgi:hypothetical protein